eukprot:CAMPEP_0185801610 /NCGR_PEP_ID=MMETSP1322-20130828/1526_1 /TAXON_ID=265543 /ORGANISM="Minutocellus polymorphus, Strain RCC2270" /LENGTH=385 /DNA_ID=CAMNT_0028497315 /DNA_START=304 /DNA_END=1461 /DNA_ORIENTATION=+
MPLPAPASGAGDGAAYGLAAGQAIDASTMMTPDALAGGIGSRLPPDAAETVHEMHLALMYLLSNPQEFNKALTFEVGGSGASMQDWNADFDDNATDVSFQPGGPDGAAGGIMSAPPPLPYAVFSDDAEVVLPQAHTANQLFGLERESGIELEAACGIQALSQLFLRWLALMPEGDHMNIIDPPGLTVMRIAGGRYRCTAAHRVVWTWNSEFPRLFTQPTTEDGSAPSSPASAMDGLHMGDLVTMTIVDVFETDTDGRLLSYCPTFDNRNIKKTMKTAEQLRKGGSKVVAVAKVVAKSDAAARFNSAAILVTRLSLKAAVQVKDSVVKRIDDEMQKAAAAKKGIPIDVNRGESGSEGDSPAGGDKGTEEKSAENFGEQDGGKLASC